MIRRASGLAAFMVVCLALCLASSAQPRGHADFTRYFAIGDSFTAGFTNGTMVERYQRSSFPALLARQAGSPVFRQPLIAAPGLISELELVGINPLDIKRKQGGGRLIGGQSPVPNNNLGVPIARIRDILSISGLDSTNNLYYDDILGRHGKAIDQMVDQKPTFVTIWAGNRDALVGVTQGRPILMTPVPEFERDLRELLTRVVEGAPNAGIVIANIPDFTRFPVATGIPPFVIHPVTGRPVLGADGRPLTLLGEFAPLPPDALVNLKAMIYILRGAGIPLELAPLFNRPDVGDTLADEFVILREERIEVEATIAAYNEVIARVAQEHSIPLVDTNALFHELEGGVVVGGVRFDLRFLFGGLIGLDGVSPTPIGNAFVANAFIDTINEAWDARIDHVSLGRDFNPVNPRGRQ